MKFSINISDSEKKIIINNHKSLMKINEQIVTNHDSVYDYKKEGGNYFFKKKDSQEWKKAVGKGVESIKQNVFKEKVTSSTRDIGLSRQVKSQIEYLKKNNLLSDQSFTILDDRDSKVYAFNPNYKLYKKYNVITGKNRGDKLNTKTIVDYVKENKNIILNAFKDRSVSDAFTYIKECYLNNVLENKNTPAGVFKRGGFLESTFSDLFLTSFFSKTYGDQYIVWKTLEGKTIPFGFHGTKYTQRLKGLESKNCSRRKLSYGCVNFNDSDIKDINKFISPGQISIWLPDSGGILELPKEYFNKQKPSYNSLRQYYDV